MTTQSSPRDDGPDVAAVLEARAHALARPADDAAARQHGVLHLVVRVGPHRIAVPASKARQCSPPQPVATLPASGGGKLLGLVPTSAGVVAVADLADLLDVTAAIPIAQRPMVVVDNGGEGLALLVDELEALADIEIASVTNHTGALTVAGPQPGTRVLDVDALLEALADPDRPQLHQTPGALP